MFRRFFDEGLAQSSYLLACERTREAVVIDPRRDVAEYVQTAAQHGLTITHAVETHIHADFVSGARELAALGAAVVAGPGSSLAYAGPRDIETRDGQTLRLSDLELTFLHTPGHTPEHISVLARQPGGPGRVFTGDTLFVGAVGRPDLLGQAVMHGLANDLHDSLFRKLLTLPGELEVHPGHGAGSLCGTGIGGREHSTIADERRLNALLQHESRDAFVAAVLGDLPDTPSYFPRMKRVNREGPPVLGLSRGIPAPPPLSAPTAAQAVASGAWLLDLRTARAFGDGHPAGAINMTFGPKIGFWAGWLVPEEVPIVLLAEDISQAVEAKRQLLLVGLDRVDGYIHAGFAAWRAADLPIRRTAQITPAELRARHQQPDAITLIDVRSAREWQGGHVRGAVHIPIHELADRAPAIPAGAAVATMCEGGYRSSLAASLLERHGVSNVVNVIGGMGAWRALEPTTTSS